MIKRALFLLLLLWCAGCGSSSELASAGSSRGPLHKSGITAQSVVGNVTVTLNPGWNGVGLQAQQVTSLTAGPNLPGAYAYGSAGYAALNLNPAEINQGDKARRGLWVFNSGSSPTTFTYSGTDDGLGNFIDLRQGYNLVSFTTSVDIPCSSLTASVNGQPASVGSAVLSTFTEIDGTSYVPLNVLGGGSLKPGRAYWVFAAAGNTRLRWAGGAPSPQPLPSPVVSPMTDEQVAAAIEAADAALKPLPSPLDLQVVAQVLGSIPGFQRVRVTEDGTVVTAMLLNGIGYSVLNNRRPEAVAAPDRAREVRAADTNRKKALILNSHKSSLNYPLLDVALRPSLEVRGYAVTARAPTIALLKDPTTFTGAPLVVFSGHGATIDTGGIQERFGYWTADEYDSFSVKRNRADLDSGALAYFRSDGETRLAVTDRFVQSYITFDKALVIFACCKGVAPEALFMKSACFDKGATLYGGWTANVLATIDAIVVSSFVDRLLGANKFDPKSVLIDIPERLWPTLKEGWSLPSPPLRPFNWKALFRDYSTRGLTAGSNLDRTPTTFNVYHASSLTAAGESNEAAGTEFSLAPSIAYLETQETVSNGVAGSRLVIAGSFGANADGTGKVTLNNVTLAYLPADWTPTQITCTLPTQGPFGGRVQVVVDEHPSNAKPLTEWRGIIRLGEVLNTSTNTSNGGVVTVTKNNFLDVDMHLRGMLAPFRNTPSGTPTVRGAVYRAVPDSRYLTVNFSMSRQKSIGGTSVYGTNPNLGFPLTVFKNGPTFDFDCTLQIGTFDPPAFPMQRRAFLKNAGVATVNQNSDPNFEDLSIPLPDGLRLDPTNQGLQLVNTSKVETLEGGSRTITWAITGGALLPVTGTLPLPTDEQ